MPNHPKVSVCIPSYNHARFLPMALDSVLFQTYRDFEIIIVDDGSSDESPQILKSYADRYPSIVRVFTHPGRRHMGISATANLAFQKSRGIYWCGLPSDDAFYPDKLKRQVAFLDGNPGVGFVYSYAHIVDETGQRTPGSNEFGIDISHEPDPMTPLIQANVIPAMTVMARRGCIQKVGMHDEALIYSDWELWIRLLAHWDVGFIRRPLAIFRWHEGNTSVGPPRRCLLERGVAVLTTLRGKAALIGGRLESPRRRALIDLQLAYHFFLLGNTHMAANGLRAAFETDVSLGTDPAYVVQWLYSRGNDRPVDPTSDCDFGSWVLATLPLIAGKRFSGQVCALLAVRKRAVAALGAGKRSLQWLLGERGTEVARKVKRIWIQKLSGDF